jgi:hypothetical protein
MPDPEIKWLLRFSLVLELRRQGLGFAEIGEKLGVCRQRAQQLYLKAERVQRRQAREALEALQARLEAEAKPAVSQEK